MFGDRLMGGCLPLKQAMEVRVLLPECVYPGTPIGRAPRLKPEGVQVRLLLRVLCVLWHGTPIWQSDQAQTLVRVGSTPTRAMTRRRRPGIGEPKWL